VEWEADADVESVSPRFSLVRTDLVREEGRTRINRWQRVCVANGGFCGGYFTRSIENATCSIARTHRHWGRFPFVVTPYVFEQLGRVSSAFQPIDMPVPVFVSFPRDCYGRGFMGPTSYPYVENPDSMIILYPFDSFDGAPRVYPYGFHDKHGITDSVWFNHDGSVTAAQPPLPRRSFESAPVLTYGNGMLHYRSGADTDTRLSVHSVRGARVMHESAQGRVSCVGLASGVYVATLRDGTGRVLGSATLSIRKSRR
jgi:hypothetical protein